MTHFLGLYDMTLKTALVEDSFDHFLSPQHQLGDLKANVIVYPSLTGYLLNVFKSH